MPKIRIVNPTPPLAHYGSPITPMNDAPMINYTSLGYANSQEYSFDCVAMRDPGTATSITGLLGLLNNSNNYYSGLGYRRLFNLHKGTPPALADFKWYGWSATNNADTSVTIGSGYYTRPCTNSVATFRAADILTSFPISAAVMSVNSLALTLAQATAIQTGTATWFSMFVIPGYNGNQATRVFPHILVGTLSAISGGGDLEIPNVAITSGNIYKLPQVEIKLPFLYSA